MDQALKARLIGAAVLVALAVLLIPELLTGRKPASTEDAAAAVAPGTRTFTIELAGSSPDTAPAAKSVPAPAQAPAPAPEVLPGQAASTAAPGNSASPAAGAKPQAEPDSVSRAPAGGKPVDRASTPGTGPSTPAPSPVPAASPDARPGAARSGWSVQVGAFSTRDKAEKLAGELRSAGYQAYLSPVTKSGKTLQRVRVGPEANRSSAEGLAVKLKARGLPVAVVAGD